jgi:uncharacterized membrane protein
MLLPLSSDYAEATAINNRGVVVGWGYSVKRGNAIPQGFINRGGIHTRLLPPGWGYSWAFDINNHGEVVGWGGEGYSGTGNGFVYSRGMYTTLLPPGWIQSQAWGINNKGIVVGSGTDGNNIQKMFIAVPKSSLLGSR